MYVIMLRILASTCFFQCNLVSISPMFYERIFRVQIPKVQKRLTTWLSFIALLGSARIKAACRTLLKLTPNFLWVVCKKKKFVDIWIFIANKLINFLRHFCLIGQFKIIQSFLSYLHNNPKNYWISDWKRKFISNKFTYYWKVL